MTFYICMPQHFEQCVDIPTSCWNVFVSSECPEMSIGRFWHLEEYVHQCSQNPLEKKYWDKVRLECNDPKDFNNIGSLSNSMICI